MPKQQERNECPAFLDAWSLAVNVFTMRIGLRGMSRAWFSDRLVIPSGPASEFRDDPGALTFQRAFRARDQPRSWDSRPSPWSFRQWKLQELTAGLCPGPPPLRSPSLPFVNWFVALLLGFCRLVCCLALFEFALFSTAYLLHLTYPVAVLLCLLLLSGLVLVVFHCFMILCVICVMCIVCVVLVVSCICVFLWPCSSGTSRPSAAPGAGAATGCGAGPAHLRHYCLLLLFVYIYIYTYIHTYTKHLGLRCGLWLPRPRARRVADRPGLRRGPGCVRERGSAPKGVLVLLLRLLLLLLTLY